MEFPRQDPPDIDPTNEDIEFQVTDWYIPENDRAADHHRRVAGYPMVDGPPQEYEIYMYGATEDGHSVATKVTGFKPYFYVKVPQDWDDIHGLEYTLLQARVTR